MNIAFFLNKHELTIHKTLTSTNVIEPSRGTTFQIYFHSTRSHVTVFFFSIRVTIISRFKLIALAPAHANNSPIQRCFALNVQPTAISLLLTIPVTFSNVPASKKNEWHLLVRRFEMALMVQDHVPPLTHH